MNALRPSRRYLIVAGLLLGCFVLSEVYFRVLVGVGFGDAVPLAARLETVPTRLGSWAGMDRPIPGETLMKIGAQDHLSRDYTRRGVTLHLYIAYFGGIRGTAPHHPDVCMPGAGYDRIDGQLMKLKLNGFGDEAIEVHRDVFERTGDMDKRLVVWWEYVQGENVANRWMQQLKWALPGILGGKRGSILQVQVGARFTGGSEERMGDIMEFIDLLGPSIGAVLPKDAPDAGANGDNGTR